MTNLSLSPPKMSDAALDDNARLQYEAEPDERFASLECDLAKQCEDTNDMFSAIQSSIAALTAAQSVPKRAKLPETLKTTPVAAPTKNRLRPGLPLDFDGNRAKGRNFLKSCSLYMSLCSGNFADDQAKILWVLFYMKSGHASDFASNLVEYAETNGRDYYADWPAFRVAFIENFLPADEATVALLHLESNRFYQGKRTVDEYLDKFKTLVCRSGYKEKLGIIMKFRHGLNREIHDKIAEQGATRPADNQPDLWYEAAQLLDRNRLANDMFHGTATRRMAVPPQATAPPARGSFVRFPLPAPAATGLPQRPPIHSPFPNALFAPPARDATRDKPAALTCYRCGKPGHTSRECPCRIDVCALTAVECKELMQDLLAAKDVVKDESVAVVDEATEEEEEEEVQPAGFAHCDG
jgi:hypothetical protein